MGETVNACKDCKHFLPPNMCGNPRGQLDKWDYINGTQKNERQSIGLLRPYGICGHEGKLWEAKELSDSQELMRRGGSVVSDL